MRDSKARSDATDNDADQYENDANENHLCGIDDIDNIRDINTITRELWCEKMETNTTNRCRNKTGDKATNLGFD